jgi:hypothetical protein
MKRQWVAEFGDWWDSPASLSGRHHRPGQTQLGHAVGVLRLAALHWRRVPWETTRKSRQACRSFLRAAFFHDVGKAIDRSQHEVAGCRWMRDRDPFASFLILLHMGRWGPGYRDTVRAMVDLNLLYLDAPSTRWLADLLAGCDYTDAVCF